MKKILVLLFLMPHFFIFGQKKKYVIAWETPKTISTGSYSITIPTFNAAHFVFDLENGVQFVDQWPINTAINEASVKLTNVVYASIPQAYLNDLDIKTIPKELKYRLVNSKSRDKRYAFFQLTPLVKDANGNFKKVVSFEINYSTDASKSLLGAKGNSFKKVITNSVLRNGEWYKFYVDTTGVFKLSKDFLQRLGVNVNNVDPRNIKLFGNGGKMIPYLKSEPYPLDIQENAIKFVGEDDGVFNNEDYILFYAQGPKGYDEERKTNINCYTNKTYYFINVGSGNGKRIQPFLQPTGTVDLVINTFQDYKFHEIDAYNIALLGSRWFGDRFDVDNSKTFEFDFPDLVTTEPIRLKVYMAAASSSNSSMAISVNGNTVSTESFFATSDRTLASDTDFDDDINVNTSTISVGLEYNNMGNPSALGYLDYISIEATRALNFQGNQFQFKNNAVATLPGIGQYTISNASGVSEVWEVTDIYNVSNFVNTEAETNLSFTSSLGVLKTYVAVTPSDYFEPKFDQSTTVANQNIKGTIFLNDQGDFQDVDYIIVAPVNMLTQANRLAEINRKQYNLNVKVLGLDQIYN